MASIQKRGPRKDGTYSYQIQWRDRDTGKPERWTFEEEAEAEKWRRLISANGESLKQADRVFKSSALDGPTVAEAITSHVEQLVGTTPYTLKRYRADIRLHFDGPLGRMKVKAVTQDDVIDWIKWMQDRGKGPKTIATKHGLMSSAFETATRRDIIPKNPCKGVRLPKNIRVGDDGDDIDMDDFRAIRGLITKHFHPFMDFLVGTGCRFSEATPLVARDFRLDAPVPMVMITKAHKLGGDENPARYVGDPKSRKSRRRVSLAPSTVESVRSLVEAAAKDGGPVFRMQKGGVLDAQAFFNRGWNKARNAAGFAAGGDKHVTVHSIRHLHAALMLQAGMSMYELSARLGHGNISVTIDTYSHLLPDAHFRGSEIAHKALGGSPVIIPEVA